MIRSVLREKSKDFFEILRYDRNDWVFFWNDYVHKNPEFMVPYCRALDLKKEDVVKHLYSYERRFLDSLMNENATLKSVKAKTAKALSSRQDKLKLKQSDFTVFMIGALGIREFTAFSNQNGTVVLMDIVALKKAHHLAAMPEITLEYVEKMRELIDASEGGKLWVSKESVS